MFDATKQKRLGDFVWDFFERKGKLFKGALAGVAALAAVGLATDYYLRSVPAYQQVLGQKQQIPEVDFTEYSIAGLLKIVQETEYSEHMIGAAHEAVAQMEEQEYTEALVGFDERVYQIGEGRFSVEQLLNHLSSPILYHKDSKIAKLLEQYLGAENAFVLENTEWILFAPRVLYRTGREQKEVEGLYPQGETFILVGTLEEGGLPHNPYVLSDIIAHETDHKATPNVEPALREELPAFKRGLSALGEPTEDEAGEITLRRKSEEQIIETGEYLLAFGDDFETVYPQQMILAKNLLEGRVASSVLRKYTPINTGNELLDAELSTASRVADIAQTESLERATELLYDKLEQGNALEQVNAASALEFLYPTKIVSHNIRGNLEGRPSTYYVGKGNIPKYASTFSSREELGRGSIKRRWMVVAAPLGLAHLFEKEKEVVYEDVPEGDNVGTLQDEAERRGQYARNLATSTTNDSYDTAVDELNRILPSLPGKPEDGAEVRWSYCGYVADQSGGLSVLYQTKAMSVDIPERGGRLFLTKQDMFQEERFVEAHWTLLPEYIEQSWEKDPPRYAVQGK